MVEVVIKYTNQKVNIILILPPNKYFRNLNINGNILILGHITYEQPEPEYHSSPPAKYHVYNYYSKDKDLADLFEIALTALAFLAFKMFVVHVIMCIASVVSTLIIKLVVVENVS